MLLQHSERSKFSSKFKQGLMWFSPDLWSLSEFMQDTEVMPSCHELTDRCSNHFTQPHSTNHSNNKAVYSNTSPPQGLKKPILKTYYSTWFLFIPLFFFIFCFCHAIISLFLIFLLIINCTQYLLNIPNKMVNIKVMLLSSRKQKLSPFPYYLLTGTCHAIHLQNRRALVPYG